MTTELRIDLTAEQQAYYFKLRMSNLSPEEVVLRFWERFPEFKAELKRQLDA